MNCSKISAITFVSFFMVVAMVPIPSAARTLSLEDCQKKALQQNRLIKEKKLEIEAAQHIKKNAITHFFPKVDASLIAWKSNEGFVQGTIPQMNLPIYDGNPANLETATEFAYMPEMEIETLDYMNAMNITIVQPLFAGGRIYNGHKLAKLGVDIRKQQLTLSELEVLRVTESYFWTIVALEQKKKTIIGYKRLLLSLKKDVDISFSAGLIQKADVLKVQLELSKIKQNQLQLNNGIEMLKRSLCNQMGINYSDDFKLVRTSSSIVDPKSYYTSPYKALSKRGEYKLLNSAVEAERLQKKISRGETLPQLSVGAAATFADVMDDTSTKGVIFANLTVPISDWWGGYHKLKEHDARIRIAENRIQDSSALLVLQMEKTYNDFEEHYQQYQIAKDLETQSSEHLKVVKDNYDSGVVAMSDLLDAQATFQKAKDGVVDAEVGYYKTKALYLDAVVTSSSKNKKRK